MIKLSYEQILEKIQKQTNKPTSEIEPLIENKLKQLSDLISKEGAAHIVANELKVKLFDNVEGKQKIKDLVAGMNSIEVLAKVTNNYGVREFQKDGKPGKVASLMIGDETGTCRMVMWDTNHISEIENNNLTENKVIIVKNAYDLREVLQKIEESFPDNRIKEVFLIQKEMLSIGIPKCVFD